MIVTVSPVSIRKLETIAKRAEKLLDCQRYEKMMAYHRREDRLRSLGASLLMKKAAAGRTIQYNEAGKPCVSDVQFNVSHSGEYVVLAEADRSVGIDIEQISTSEEEWMRMALSPNEYEWLLKKRTDGEDFYYWFYVLWTRKESLVKCEGHGFLQDPADVTTLPIEKALHIPYRGKRYGVEHVIFHDYILSAALQEAIPEILIRKEEEVWKEIL